MNLTVSSDELSREELLELSRGVYSKRDSHFRKLVKEFKTVNDSDYEVPESLQNVMRNYQVTGYKWLRTLAVRLIHSKVRYALTGTPIENRLSEL